jgi:sugar/nucleoside kinase (ribokinase family)
VIALLGNLSRDLKPGQPPEPGGAPYHAARALAHIDTPARIYARCAAADRAELLPSVNVLGTPVEYVAGRSTASFEISYDGSHRRMTVLAIGDSWTPRDVPELPDGIEWVHVAPLLRSDFPPSTLAAIAKGRRLSLDGQGLVRPARTGELVLDDDYDPALLRHVWVLKLSEEEAEVLGDPLRLGVRELLLTRGARGATVHWQGREAHVPAFEIESDPTGAGDAFCIAYLAGRSRGFSPTTAARRATAVVASMLAGA